MRNKDFPPDSKKAFESLKKISKYNLFERKDGSVVSAIKKEDGTICNEPEEISAVLIQELRKIQDSPRFEHKIVPFPTLPMLSELEAKQIVDSIPHDKALSSDLFSGSALNSPEIVEKLTRLIKSL